LLFISTEILCDSFLLLNEQILLASLFSVEIFLKDLLIKQMSETKPLSNINNAEIEHQVTNLEELNLADHVIISLSPTEYRHAIVNSLNKEEHQIEIIFYDDSQIKCSLSQFEQEETVTVSCEKNGVKKSLLIVDLTQFQLYKVDYTKNNQKCLSERETLEKACKFLGQTKYNIFTNNDEHFCIYCKTGKAAKVNITYT